MAFEDWFIARARVSSRPHRKVTMDDKMAFFQQLATLISAGSPLLEAINLAAEHSQSVRLRQVLTEVAERVASGSSLSNAAGEYRDVFEHYWIEVMRTGEVTGNMAMVLTELNKSILETRETRRKISGALMYPLILVCAAVGAVTLMLWLVVPTFAEMFKQLGTTLPAMTQFVVDLSEFIVADGLYMLGGLIGTGVAFRFYWRTDGGRRRISAIAMAMPLAGDLMVQSAMYRFATNIALLLKSGIPMLEALGVLRKVFQLDPIYRDALEQAENRVAAGWSLMAALEESALFTTMITSMVRIGEESGQLAPVMERIAPYYKERMQSFIAKITKLMEPVIIVGLGGTIAVLMLAIYMPMFEMAGKVH
jgi:type IV pilus assembly protein PilC